MTIHTENIVVDSAGELIVFIEGHLSATPAQRKAIKKNVLLGEGVRLIPPFGEKIIPSLDPKEPLNVVAALFSLAPGRSHLLEAPRSVRDYFELSIKSSSCSHSLEGDK